MLYEEARVYLDHVSKYGSVLGLESIKSLLDKLENPQKDLTFIQIAGTNGKGSILCYLSEILTTSGYRTGRYSSPVVMEELEGIQVDGRSISKDDMAELTSLVKNAVDELIREGRPSPTVFEIETAIAFLYFKRQACDYVVLETGLGGGLDATNIVENTILSVFAPISMDHMHVLGDTIEKIAQNKAGIIKSGSTVVTAAQNKKVFAVLKSRAEEKGCPIYKVDREKIQILRSDLWEQKFCYKEFEDLLIKMAGRYQTENAATALEAILALKDTGVKIAEGAVYQGLKNVKWKGRFEILGEDPLFIIDGAHNVDAAKRLAENIKEYLLVKKITAIVGIFKDKEYDKILDIMSPYLTTAIPIELPNRERSLSKEELMNSLNRCRIHTEDVSSLEEAVEKAYEITDKNDVILAFGSLSYLGKVAKMAEGKES